jgi:hypothetical protein
MCTGCGHCLADRIRTVDCRASGESRVPGVTCAASLRAAIVVGRCSMDTQARRRLWVLGCVVGIFAITLSSCPVPFDIAILNRVKDVTGPAITVDSPTDRSYCANIIEIAGSVTDTATEGQAGGVATLTYEVLGTTVSGNATVEAGGSFAFQLVTTDFGDTFTLALTATDWNGNSTTESLTLLRSGENGIPSFSVVAGNRSVELEWDEVPGTASYALRYTTNGALPSDAVGIEIPDVTSGMEIEDLENGNAHVFQLRAIPEDSLPESISDYVRVVPLSEQSLAPRATGKVTGIMVEWMAIPAEDTYEVWRSTTINGAYFNLSGPVDATSYYDTDVAPGHWYYYKVGPTDYDNDLSAAGAAQLSRLTIHEPQLLSTVSFPGAVPDDPEGDNFGFRVTVDGNYAYVGDVSNGLQVVNILEPDAAWREGTCPITGGAIHVAVDGDYAFVASGEAGLTVVSTSDKANPSVVTTVPWDFTPADETWGGDIEIARSGEDTYVYVATSSSLEIFDISTPTVPDRRPHIDVQATALAIDGDYLYVACDPDGDEDIKVFDLADVGGLASPTLLTTVGGNADLLFGHTWGIDVEDGYAYVAQHANGIIVIDVNNPVDPERVGQCQTANLAYDVVVEGPYAYVAAESSGLQVINVSDPTRVNDDSVIAGLANYAWGGGLGIARQGQYVYMAEWYHELSIMSASVPDAADIVGTLGGLGESLGLTIREEYAYVADHASGLRVVDVVPASSPSLASTLDVKNHPLGGYDAYSVAVSGNRAYIAETFMVADITNPAAPAMLGSTYVNGWCFDIQLMGSYAFTSNGDVGLHIVDNSTGEAPFIRTLRATTGNVNETAVRFPYVFAADGPNGLHVFEVSGTADLDEVAMALLVPDPAVYPVNPPERAISISVEGDLAVVLGGNSGPWYPGGTAQLNSVLHLVDIADPSDPSEYDLIPLSAPTDSLDLSTPSPGAQAVELAQGFAFVVNNDPVYGRLDIIDVAQPDVPFIVATVGIPNATDLSFSGQLVYVTTSSGTFTIVDLLPDL